MENIDIKSITTTSANNGTVTVYGLSEDNKVYTWDHVLGKWHFYGPNS